MPKELSKALEQYNQAYNAFDNADSDHIDLAIEKLNIAQYKLNCLYRKYKFDNPSPSSLQEGEGFTS